MTRKPFIYILFGVLVLGAIVGRLSSCGETSGGPNNWAPLDYEANPHSTKYDFGAVDAAVAELMADHPAVRGVTLAVVRRGESQIYEKGYGDFDRDRISLLASTTKVLSAGVILTLVDDGVLDLDRPVAEYLGWGDYHPTVTVRHLLSMMSGIPANILGTCFPALCMCDPSTTVQTCGRDVFQNDSTSILPGKEFRYSSGAWQLAGAVAEVVSGRTWAELLEQRLVTRCGLPNTGYGNEGLLARHPEAFDPAALRPTENPWIDGGAYSTVNDVPGNGMGAKPGDPPHLDRGWHFATRSPDANARAFAGAHCDHPWELPIYVRETGGAVTRREPEQVRGLACTRVTHVCHNAPRDADRTQNPLFLG